MKQVVFNRSRGLQQGNLSSACLFADTTAFGLNWSIDEVPSILRGSSTGSTGRRTREQTRVQPDRARPLKVQHDCDTTHCATAGSRMSDIIQRSGVPRLTLFPGRGFVTFAEITMTLFARIARARSPGLPRPCASAHGPPRVATIGLWPRLLMPWPLCACGSGGTQSAWVPSDEAFVTTTGA